MNTWQKLAENSIMQRAMNLTIAVEKKNRTTKPARGYDSLRCVAQDPLNLAPAS